MLRFVTKKEYWKILEESEITSSIGHKKVRQLRTVQNRLAFAYLSNSKDKVIGQIGGENTQTLELLSNDNEVFIIEPKTGNKHKTENEKMQSDIQHINATLGEFSHSLEENFFDSLFSVSKVEHIRIEKLEDFFLDCYRVLKTGGRMIHLIDAYIEDIDGNNVLLKSRLNEYSKIFSNYMFDRISESDEIINYRADIGFKSEYVTNPDNILFEWNKTSPEMKNKRAKSQSVSIILTAKKKISS